MQERGKIVFQAIVTFQRVERKMYIRLIFSSQRQADYDFQDEIDQK